MKQILRWLKSKISPPESTLVEDRPHSSPTVNAARKSPHRSGADDLMPDIYAPADSESDVDDEVDADADTKPDLKILDPSSLESDEAAGFDPYDSGIRQKK